MPRSAAPLSDAVVDGAKPGATPYKLADGRGLSLHVRPNGGKWWRFSYRRPGTGKRNTLSLGICPGVSLEVARGRRDELRDLLARGIDPGVTRKAGDSPPLGPCEPPAFAVALSEAGTLSIVIAGQSLHLTQHQTDAVRSVLLIHSKQESSSC